MTLDQFVANWRDKPVDYDKALGFTCMDLVEQYNADVVGAPRLYGNAIDLDKNPQPVYYTRHANPLWYIPPKGSIAVFKAFVGGGYGHCGIVLSADLMTVELFEQNWQGAKYPLSFRHSYNDIISFLVPVEDDYKNKYYGLIGEVKGVLQKYQ